MKQITLEDWNQEYASHIDSAMPENEEVFFKTKSGDIVKGDYDKLHGFDSAQKDWDINDDAVEWHPVKVDM
jgi:hypothetical protein